MKSRSTSKLSGYTRLLIAIGIFCATLMIAGCAANTSRHWAQTAPTIAPTASGEPVVILGAMGG